MKLSRVSAAEIGQVDLTPQAVIQLSAADFHDRFGLVFEHGQDDLDIFEAAFFKLDGMVAALMHHRGEPKNTVSVYLRRGLTPRQAERAIDSILAEYSLASDVVSWREPAGPGAN
jgi:hypothetical protein